MHVGLYPWQRLALDCWRAANHRGVIEAVTGAGKTRVGLAAIADALDSSMRILVVVPTTVLLDQWRQQIHEHLGLQSGALSRGHKARLADHQVVAALVHSASRIERLLRIGRRPDCLRRGQPLRSHDLRRRPAGTLPATLGLTATFERNDEGLDTHLLPYFGGVTYSSTHRKALDKQVITPFRGANVRVDLDAEEQVHYEEAHREAQAARMKLICEYGLTEEPFGEFMAEVALLACGPRKDPATKLARRFLSGFTETRRILGEAPRKLDVCRHLDPAIAAFHGTLIFASTVNGALRAAHTMVTSGIRTDALHGNMTLPERRAVLNRVAQRELQVVTAPLVLDEGVDVPGANLAIILAASKTRRQMIQRLGRVARLKTDGGRAHLALVVTRKTSEDPKFGTHLGFISEMLEVADDLRVFDPPSTASSQGSSPAAKVGHTPSSPGTVRCRVPMPATFMPPRRTRRAPVPKRHDHRTRPTKGTRSSATWLPCSRLQQLRRPPGHRPRQQPRTQPRGRPKRRPHPRVIHSGCTPAFCLRWPRDPETALGWPPNSALHHTMSSPSLRAHRRSTAAHVYGV